MERSLAKKYVALAVVCVVWGTTYFALLIGVRYFPAFLFSGLRQIIAGILLLLTLKLLGKLHFSKQDFLRSALPGICMISIGNGVIGWAEQYIPSGLAALIVSILPVYIVLINLVTGLDRRKLNAYILTGLVLGCTGVFLMFRDNLKDIVNPQYLVAMLFSFGACLVWSFGSIYAKQRPSKAGVLTNAALQMFCGGTVLLFMSLILDDYSQLSWATFSGEGLWSLIYLIIFGSLLTYTCFVYALDVLPVGIVSIYAYINPFIALLLGYFWLNEPLTWLTILALFVTLGGVYFINKGFVNQEKLAK